MTVLWIILIIFIILYIVDIKHECHFSGLFGILIVVVLMWIELFDFIKNALQ